MPEHVFIDARRDNRLGNRRAGLHNADAASAPAGAALGAPHFRMRGARVGLGLNGQWRLTPHGSSAAAASRLMRSTIERKPLERCGVRCSAQFQFLEQRDRVGVERPLAGRSA